MDFNFNRTLFFTLQRLDSPGMRLRPEQVASISAVFKGKDMKDVFIWLPTAFGKSVCYETTPFVTETIPFVMDCELRRVDSKSGKNSSSPGLVLVQYVTSRLVHGLGRSYAPPHLFWLNNNNNNNNFRDSPLGARGIYTE